MFGYRRGMDNISATSRKRKDSKIMAKSYYINGN